MKKTIIALVSIATMVVGIWLVWFVGIMMNFEYPYTFTLMKVRNADSVYGVPVSQIIRGDGAKWAAKLPWHTCSYCDDACGEDRVICVKLAAPDGSTVYHFAYSYDTQTLVPMNAATARHYPSMMPSNDMVRVVAEMNGNAAQGNGYGTFELPEKWFRKATHTDTNGAANGASP